MRTAQSNYVRLLAARIGVTARGKSRRLTRALVDFGVEESFQKANERLREHYGFELNASAVRAATLTHAARAQARLEVQYEESFRILPAQGAGQLVAQSDGSMVCTVERAPRSGPRPRQWKEMRLVAAQVHGSMERVYGAGLIDVAATGRRWGHCARAAGWGLRSRVHVIGDGAPWIERQSREVFGDQGNFLLDFYHASEYLGAAALSCRPHDPQGWRHTQQRRLKRGQSQKVLQELRRQSESAAVPEESAPVRAAWRYLESRAEQLDYAGALERELPIGSGLIESAHRHLIQARLKKPGSAWLPSSAHALAQLRVLRANGHWPSLWN